MSSLPRRSFLAAAAGTAISFVSFPRRARAALLQEKSGVGKTPHSRFAINIEMWWSNLPFIERIEKTAALGFPAVEFWPWKGKDIDAIAKRCRELGIAVAQFTAWGFSPGLNDQKNHGAFVKAIEEGCAVAKKLDCKAMTVVGGDDRPGISRAEMHAQIIAGLKAAAPIAEKADVTLILEPMNIRVDHKGHCLYGSTDAIAICRAVASSHVKINWDLYHMQISEGDLCGRLRDGFEHVGYLQLADNPGRHEPGTGEIHYNRVLKEAHDLGYRGFIGAECTPLEGEEKAAHRLAAADVW